MSARRVLVIEDETSSREALESLLSEEGYIVRTASTGEAGLACHVDFHPDIIICDYYLPDIDGLRVMRMIRACDPGARFIMVTAGMGGAENERALRREADAFLCKPIDLDDFTRALHVRAMTADRGFPLNVPL